MSLTLAIDTSHRVAVGLARDGEPLASRLAGDTRSHAELLMPEINRLCVESGVELPQVDEFAVGMGPGPFTGLRVGIVAARTLALMAGRDVHGVCSLDVVARLSGRTGEFVVASDARRREVYFATYRDGVRVGDPQVGPVADLPDLPVVGHIPDELREGRGVEETALDAGVMAAVWRQLPPAGPEPFYLRPADATVGGPAKSTLTSLRRRR